MFIATVRNNLRLSAEKTRLGAQRGHRRRPSHGRSTAADLWRQRSRLVLDDNLGHAAQRSKQDQLQTGASLRLQVGLVKVLGSLSDHSR